MTVQDTPLHRFPLVAVTIAALLGTSATLAADATNGKELHQKHCAGCHDDSVYKRADRRVSDKQALQGQITGCQHAANAKLSKAQINDLVHYLNQTYYKFK